MYKLLSRLCIISGTKVNIVVSLVIIMFLSGYIGPWFGSSRHKGRGYKGGLKDQPRTHKFVE